MRSGMVVRNWNVWGMFLNELSWVIGSCSGRLCEGSVSHTGRGFKEGMEVTSFLRNQMCKRAWSIEEVQYTRSNLLGSYITDIPDQLSVLSSEIDHIHLPPRQIAALI
jgi:hypothetical protein